MESNTFIKNKLTELVNNFPQIKARYELDEFCSLYTIEVVPNEIYNNNHVYQQWEEDVTFEFIDLYPEKNISFITDNSLVPITTANFIVAGAEFGLPSFSLNYWDLLSDFKLTGLFESYEPLIPKNIAIPSLVKPLPTFDIFRNLSCRISNNKTVIDKNVEILDLDGSSKENTLYPKAGENQYALAA